MLEMVDKFSGWLIKQLNQRGWSQAELARNAEVSRTAISDVISEKHTAGFDLCLAISRALKIPPEIVFRAAGLLPPVPPDTQYAEEVLFLLNQLSCSEQLEILELLRFKAERKLESKRITPTRASRKIKPPAQTVLNGQ
jgi:transcriptional regulator with XRE-family HTH domain